MYDDVDCHASRAELEEDPRVVFCSRVVVTAEALEVSLVGVGSFVICVHAAWVELVVSFGVIDSNFGVLVAEHALVAFHFEELCEQYFEVTLWYSVVYQDVDEHASGAKLEVDPAAVFCSCIVVAAQALEVGFVGVEALPVAVVTHWIFH